LYLSFSLMKYFLTFVDLIELGSSLTHSYGDFYDLSDFQALGPAASF